MMTDKLRQKIDVYVQGIRENELGENEPYMIYSKSIYCEILPQSSSIKSLDAGAEYNEHQFKIKARYNSLKGIKKEWEFKHGTDTYKINYFNVDYKNREYIEVFCVRVEE